MMGHHVSPGAAPLKDPDDEWIRWAWLVVLLDQQGIKFPAFVLLLGLECRDLAMKEAACFLERPSIDITRLADHLESHGFSKRVHDPEDRRTVTLRIQPAGRMFLDAVSDRVGLRLLSLNTQADARK